MSNAPTPSMNNPSDVIFTGTARGWETAGTDTAALAAPEIPFEHEADEKKSSLVFQMLCAVMSL